MSDTVRCATVGIHVPREVQLSTVLEAEGFPRPHYLLLRGPELAIFDVGARWRINGVRTVTTSTAPEQCPNQFPTCSGS